jgi:hypothetical protein
MTGRIFITGTDTGVGKTMVACALLRDPAMACQNENVAALERLLSAPCIGSIRWVARMRPNGSRSKRDPIFRIPAIHAKIARFFIDKLSR